jgi:tetratricopeptide (TPR) repeat protein
MWEHLLFHINQYKKEKKMKKITFLLTTVFVLLASTLYAQTAQTRLDNGKRLFDQRNYDGAIQELNEAIKLDPNMAEAYAYRARAYSGNNNDQAISDANKAIQLNPRLAMGYLARGTAYYYKKDYDRAIAEYTEAIRIDPNYVNAYYNRGSLYFFNKNDNDKAIADYTEVIRLDPNNANVYNNRGIAYYNKKEYNRALADFEAAIKIDPNNSNAKDNLAKVKPLATQESPKKYDPSKFIVVPSYFDPSEYTSVDLFKAASNAKNLQVALSQEEAFSNQMQSGFMSGMGGSWFLQYVSDLKFVRQNGTDITFSSDDNAITQNMSIDQRSGLQAGQKVRVYYTIMRAPLTRWDVIAIERR